MTEQRHMESVPLQESSAFRCVEGGDESSNCRDTKRVLKREQENRFRSYQQIKTNTISAAGLY